MKAMPRRRSLRFVRLLMASDARRCGRSWWKDPGFWTVFSYRVRHARRNGNWICRLLMLPTAIFARILQFFASDAMIPADVRIGPSFNLPHPNGVIITPGSRIGSDVTIFQQVTLGMWEEKRPRIRSHASIFAGAKIIGGVNVGMRAFVGANAVVVKDVPDWHSAVGVPATVRPRSDRPGAAQIADISPRRPTNGAEELV